MLECVLKAKEATAEWRDGGAHGQGLEFKLGFHGADWSADPVLFLATLSFP